MDHSSQAAAIFNKYASEYERKFMDVSLYRASFDFFCDSLTQFNAKILELACGPGNISKYLLTKRPDFKLLGTDLSPNMLDLAKHNNPNADFQLLDAREIGKIKTKYDGIMCGFCFPYLSMQESEKLIKDAHNILKRGGLLFISTMEDNYSKSGFKKGSQGDEIFMHFYLEEDIRSILRACGFKISKLERIESDMTDGTKVTDLIVIASKI